MRNLFIAAIMSVSVILASTTVYAGEKIAIVAIQQIIQKSAAAESIRKQLQDQRDSYQKEITKQEESLHKKDQELAGQKSLMAPEAFREKVLSFKKEVSSVQDSVQKKRLSLDRAYNNAIKKVQTQAIKIVEEISEDKGITVAIQSSQILFFKEGLDISEDVLAELNKRLPSVEITTKSTANGKSGS